MGILDLKPIVVKSGNDSTKHQAGLVWTGHSFGGIEISYQNQNLLTL